MISILAVQLLLGASEAETAAGLSESALKSLLTVILGGLLFIIQLAAFFQTGSSIAEIVINIILLVIPYYYFHNAVRNIRINNGGNDRAILGNQYGLFSWWVL